MPFVWLVECKTCLQTFAALPREVAPKNEDAAPAGVSGTRVKSTSALPPHEPVGTFECPHCHDRDSYLTDDLIPGEGRIVHE